MGLGVNSKSKNSSDSLAQIQENRIDSHDLSPLRNLLLVELVVIISAESTLIRELELM